MTKRGLPVAVLLAASVAASVLFAMTASAESQPLPSRQVVFDSINACDPGEQVLDAIADIAAPADGDPLGSAKQALVAFADLTYPGLPLTDAYVLREGDETVRFAFESARGLELLVDVSTREDRFGVAGWTGCNEYLVSARAE